MPYKTLIFLLAVVIISGCSDDSDYPVVPQNSEYVQMFDSFYNNFDRTYSYFIYKNINWEEEKQKYESEVNMIQNDIEFIDLLRLMVEPLKDVHVWFRSGDYFIKSYSPNTFKNFDKKVWQTYVGDNNWQQQESNWGYATFDETPYFAFGAWNSDQLQISDFDAALENFKESEKIIIDVRMNGGGNDALALDIAGRFINQTRIVEYVKYRNGPQHDDFTELIERKLSPRGDWQFTQPVFVLIGRGCYSSNETFISAMGEIPHVTLIGDTTGGSSGNPRIFEFGNGWEYSVPTWIAYTPDMQVIEWNGIAPDIYIKTTIEDFQNGIDPVLDYALSLNN